MRRLALLVLATLVFLTAGCGGDDEGVPSGSFAIVVNTDIAAGENRLLVGLLGPDGARLGSPDLPIRLRVEAASGAAEPRTVDGRFMWIVEGVTGIYRATVELPEPGAWQATVVLEDGEEFPPIDVLVAADAAVPWVGDLAPTPDTPTLADRPLADLTTDPDPDERFYSTSVADAVAAGDRTVLVFSTPAFCQTQACGPMLDIVKSVADDHPDVTFIHVEVYEGFNDPNFTPNPRYLAPAARSSFYNLPSEPWVFVIDEGGLIEARFEGVMERAELETVLG